MSTKLVLKPQQKLLMNPVIHTFIGFLPLSRIEFVDKIRNEIDSNPMLELEVPVPEKEEPEATNVMEKKIERADQSLFNSYIEDGFLRNRDKLDKNSVIELFGSSKITLAEHLIQQAQVQFTEKELELAKYIIYNLKEDGYLDFEVESVASSLNSTPEEMENIRNIIKTFDPRGVASKSLSECLLSQIEDVDENMNLIELIKYHLGDLSRSKFSDILAQLKIERNELNHLIKKLRRLKKRLKRL